MSVADRRHPMWSPETMPPRINLHGAILAHLGSAALICLLFLWPTFEKLGIQGVAVLSIGLAIVLGCLVAKSLNDGVWSFPFLYFLILCLFHLGLFLSPAINDGRMASFLDGIWTGWYSDSLMIRAAYLIDLGLLSYATAVGFVSWMSRDLRPKFKSEIDSSFLAASPMRNSIVDVGGMALSVAVVTWLYVCVSELGPFFFLSSYIDYLKATEGSSVGLIYFGLTIGSALIAQDLTRPTSRAGLIFLLAFLVLALPMGLRSESLFPVIAALAVYIRCHKAPSSMAMVAAILIGLVAISAVQQVRSQGLGGTALHEVSVSPVKAIEEMGYSARVLVTTIGWHEASHEPYLSGATYVAPLERGVAGILGLPRVEAETDFRLMNVEIAERVGTIGGSIIAEAHHNLGESGIVLVLGLAGLIASRLCTIPPRPLPLAILGIAASLLLMHVRNSFAPIFAWGTGGLALILLAVGITWLRGRGGH
ncbi:O-antigen polysaccharide polymerase Wzy [Pseudarthrobacter sp. AL07]|uniref:O-antigen polysaccharide polymerase Wzy n=1 Tax=unclassified Pseudarthrobacter TaxID=2647000 RepID=UPI00249A34D2|nr:MULTISPECIES: O-antigen polysaccharide polymerase Wzy [unclassified Pseudarthrobacter]MDI3196000.1 O-antigen polysaccharide polymerase Wzy [Pseudarthrobacter sp. AL20]MDI3210059.1 O-antigen polysaccharide polymerase Wzy [Pseudarthrobacter sp. AL07]